MSLSMYNFIHIEAPKHEFRDERTGYKKKDGTLDVERAQSANDKKLKKMTADDKGPEDLVGVSADLDNRVKSGGPANARVKQRAERKMVV